MYKLIIADDEKCIREGLKDIIPWAETGFRVVGVFDDGAGVLEYIQNNNVDVVLTDIKMKRVSGIDIAKYVSEKKLNRPIVVFLSGYREFELAHQAMMNNVYSYILKPAKNSEIVEVFKKLKEKLDSQADEDSGDFEREQLVLDILTGNILSEQDTLERLSSIGETVNEGSSFAFITLKINDYKFFVDNVWQNGKDYLYTAIKNFLVKGKLIPLYRIGDIIPVFAIIPNFTQEKLKLILRNITEQIRLEMKADVTAETIAVYNDISTLIREKPFFSLFKRNGGAEASGYASEICGLLLMEVYEKNTGEQIQEILNLIKDNIKAMNDTDGAKLLLLSVCNELLVKMQKANKEFAFLMLELSFKEIRSAKDFEELNTAADNLFGKLLEIIQTNKPATPEMTVEQIKLYISENFEKDITLQDIAENVYLSTAYISRLFKQYAGETVSDYIIKVRMDYAIILLKQKNLKIYEVCNRVGYKSKKYFNITFKKYTGKTPSEYRETV